METTSSEDDESLKDNNVDLNDDNIEQHMSFDVSSQLTDADNLFSSHQHNSENIEPFVGMEFESEESAKLFYMAYASRVGFSVRISKSRRSRNDESIIMRRFVCSKEGFHLKKGKFDDGKKKRKRATIREGCNAMIEVIQKYYGRWVVTKLVKEHNHVVAAPSRVLYVAPESYGNADPYLGMDFPSHEAAQTFYYAYASRIGFDVRIRLSRRSTRDESFVMRRFVCTKEGFTPYEDNFDESKKKRNRTPTREGCKAMFEVIKKDYGKWIVSKLVLEHTHDLAVAPSKVHYIQSDCEVVVLAKSGTLNREKPAAPSSKTHLGKFGEFSDVPSNGNGFRTEEFEKCVNVSGTADIFESCWLALIEKFDLGENSWLQLLFDIRQKWVPAYVKDVFTAEVSFTQKPESLVNFFEKYFNTKTSLLVLASLLEQAMAGWYEREALEDLASSYTRPILSTPSNMLKQVVDIYTRTIFDVFQEEFVESLGYLIDKIDDGVICKFNVTKNEDISTSFIVTYNFSNKRTSCSCCKFETSGILCRHILRVFLTVDVRSLPECYILKRWTKDAKNGFVLDESLRYNELYRDAVKYAKEGSTSEEVYAIAKSALQIGFSQVGLPVQKPLRIRIIKLICPPSQVRISLLWVEEVGSKAMHSKQQTSQHEQKIISVAEEYLVHPTINVRRTVTDEMSPEQVNGIQQGQSLEPPLEHLQTTIASHQERGKRDGSTWNGDSPSPTAKRDLSAKKESLESTQRHMAKGERKRHGQDASYSDDDAEETLALGPTHMSLRERVTHLEKFVHQEFREVCQQQTEMLEMMRCWDLAYQGPPPPADDV
ncbi:hypothetical protein ZIOFF_066510 [Zingiber officinale]|uniref:Protein FAR1-RELATED SEQUENCE n=1 Tax=Zingiber officinale TaxID=94328 RepID=A0A8J5KHW5_ZINOF|nr:hypothetical protein ZIOFF_066510 [Zingiber officinale]